MIVVAIQYDFPATVDKQHMDTGEKLKYPAGARAGGRGAELAGKALLLLLERLSNAVFQGAIDQKTEGHDHHQCHDTLRRFEKQGVRHEPGVF